MMKDIWRNYTRCNHKIHVAKIIPNFQLVQNTNEIIKTENMNQLKPNRFFKTRCIHRKKLDQMIISQIVNE